jgi:hypothetical protein
MKNVSQLLIAVLILCGFWVSPSSAMVEKNYVAERYDVLIEVQPGGDLLVAETVVFRFQGGPFTYVFRELDPVETDGITNLQAYLDGQSLSEGTGPGQVEIQLGKPIRVTWHFNPVSDATHTFELLYQVKGAIRQAGTDTLIWRAIPENHEYSIETSSITLIYPKGVSLDSTPSLSQPVIGIEANENQVLLTTRDVPSDQSIIITAEFTPGSLVSSPPGWQAQQPQAQFEIGRELPIGLGSAVMVWLIAIAWLRRALWGIHRENYTPPDSFQRLGAPPSALSPAIGLKLASGSTPALGTFFDLARRGYLSIEETKSRWGKSFLVHRQVNNQPLLPHESALLDALFKTSKSQRESLAMSEAGTKIAYGPGGFSQALDAELKAAGWVDTQRIDTRSRLLVIGLLALFIGLAFSIAMFILGITTNGRGGINTLPFTAAAVGIGGALFVAGLAALIIGASISQLSIEGEHQAARWKGFIAYLREVSRGGEPAIRPDMFEHYLPFAAGAGFAQEWAKYFQKKDGTPMPEWFRTLNGTLDGGEFAAIVAFMAVSDSSASLSADSGGSGASGGGASGAG